MTDASVHAALVSASGAPSQAVEPLTRYLDLVAAWSTRTNLTGSRTPRERVEILIAPVLDALPWIRGVELLDIGSGNGSPGLVLAVLAPQLRVVLLEPRLKRWAFLREACRTLARQDVEVRRERLEQYTGGARDVVTLRAVRLSALSVERHVRPSGRVLVWGDGLESVVESSLHPTGVHGQVQVYERVSRETGLV